MAEDFQSRGFETAFSVPTLNHAGMVHMGGRPVEPLDGEWDFLTDEYDAALRQRRYLSCPVDPETADRPWEFDFDCYDRMPVPGSWSAIAELTHFEGTAWYHRRLTACPRPHERVLLRIGAANYDTKVFLNGEFLGSHLGGSTPFFVDLTDHLTGDDRLLLAVNNARRATRVPTDNTDWTNYGGIHREVSLVRVPTCHVRDVFVRLDPDGRHILADISVAGEAAAVSLEIPGLGIRQEVTVQQGRAQARIAARPDLWSPDNPVLYDLTVTCGPDHVSDRVGFRTVSTRGDRILLNGVPVFLRGISVHEDDAVQGRSTDEADIRRRFRHAKDLNCNFLRLAHYPHHELAARIADEVGLMLWEEVPVYWDIAWENAATFQDADNQLRELILRDRNRASVIMWSVGNENVDTDARLSFLSRLAGTCRALDPSRLVTAAVLVNKERMRVEDRLAPHLDVLGLNEYYGWYVQDWDEFERLMSGSAPGKPVIISETGAGALAGYRGRDDMPFTEDYQDRVYARQIDVLRRTDYVAGITPWILYDFRCPRRRNRFQRGFNRKGLIDADKATKKAAFHRLAAFYAEVAATTKGFSDV